MEVLLFGAALAVAWWLYRRWQRWRRRRIARRPLPADWRSILERNVPLYRGLPDALREELHGHIQVFLHDKTFRGFQGLEVTEEMRLTVAGNACLLLLNRPHSEFAGFSSIYLYPDTFVSRQRSYDGLVESIGEHARLGESWHLGPVVLSWDAAWSGSRDIRDGHNLVLHEFAHKLDGADGVVDGAPIFPHRSQHLSWARVMRREYEQLRHQAGAGLERLINHYGATAPQEFFAVVVETFYERPAQLKRHHPQLYAELEKCFRVDPLAWHAAIDAD